MPKDQATGRGPDSIIVDLSSCVKAYEKDVKPLTGRLDTSPSEMVKHITEGIYSREGGQDELSEMVLDIENNISAQGAPKAAACFSNAADKLGLELLNSFDRHGMYSPDGSFDYYFLGWTGIEGRNAVFRNFRNENEQLMREQLLREANPLGRMILIVDDDEERPPVDEDED